METALTLAAAVIGAAWIAGEAWLCRRRLRAVEADNARLYGMLAYLLDLRAGPRLDAHDAELERHARIIVDLHSKQTFDHQEIVVSRAWIENLDRARAYRRGHDIEAN